MIALIALCLCVVAAGFAVYGFIRLRRPTPPPATSATVFAVWERNGGTKEATTTVSSDAPLFNELVAYVNSPGVTDGDLTLASHAPGLVIETDVVRLNFLRDGVVVSTRKGPKETMHPAVRAKTAADVQIEAKARALLKQSPMPEAGR